MGEALYVWRPGLNNIPLKICTLFSYASLIGIRRIILEAMLQFSPLSKMLMSSPPSLLSIFHHESALNFFKCLLCIFCSDHVILILSSVNVVYHIDQFFNIEPSLLSQGQISFGNSS